MSCLSLSGSDLDEETLNRMDQIEGLEGISLVASFVKPDALVSLVESTVMENGGISSENGVECYLLKLARERGLQIVGLETAEEQDDALATADDAIWLYEIKTIVEDPDGYVESIRQMLRAWAEGDREALAEEDEIGVTDDMSAE